MSPARAIERIDCPHTVVHVDRATEDMREAPEYDELRHVDAPFRSMR